MKPNLDLKDTIHFDFPKEHRGEYFVEYQIPNAGDTFANVVLVWLRLPEPERAARAMESELTQWTRRYPVTVMATSLTNIEDVVRLTSVRPNDHLMGWVDSNGQLHAEWRLLEPGEYPTEPFTIASLLATYPAVPHTVSSAEDKRRTIGAMARDNRTLRNVVIVWIVVIPAAIVIISQIDQRIGWIATVLSLFKGLWKLAELKGWRRPSRRQQEKDAALARTRHHDYYCQRDPDGFNRLKAAVLEREIRERTLKEAEELKRKK
jgi:hypothetical protein